MHFIFKLAQGQKTTNGRDPLTKDMEHGKVEKEPQAHHPIRGEEDTPRDGEEPSHLASMQEMHGPTEACKQPTQRGSTVTSQKSLEDYFQSGAVKRVGRKKQKINPLVHLIKARGEFNKKPVDFRLQGVKSICGDQKSSDYKTFTIFFTF